MNTTASWVPMALAAPMITIEIRPAIKSMAVTPDSFPTKSKRGFFIDPKRMILAILINWDQ